MEETRSNGRLRRILAGGAAAVVAVAIVVVALAFHSSRTGSSPASSSGTPPARTGASFAYDAATNSVVMFGGYSSDKGYLNDTWEWNGSSWAQLHPANSPSARSDAALAFDPKTGQMILFGGDSGSVSNIRQGVIACGGSVGGSGVVSSSAIVNGVASATTTTATTPAPVDPMPATTCSGPAVMPNVIPTTITQLHDTWSWDGNNWTQQHPASDPGNMVGPEAGTDAATQSLLLVGSAFSTTSPQLCGRPVPASTPAATAGTTFSTSGGACLAASAGAATTWGWRNGDWKQLSNTSQAFSGPIHLALDPATKHLALISDALEMGVASNPACAKDVRDCGITQAASTLSEWNGTSWTTTYRWGGGASSTGPTAINAAVGDASDGYIMATDFSGDTWLWRNSGWSQTSLQAGGRNQSGVQGMVYDDSASQVIRVDSSMNTSVWNGSSWQIKVAAPSPSPTATVTPIGCGPSGVPPQTVPKILSTLAPSASGSAVAEPPLPSLCAQPFGVTTNGGFGVGQPGVVTCSVTTVGVPSPPVSVSCK